MARSAATKHNVYRDGKVHVCAEMCSTCIFRPGNLMQLERGRVRQMVEDTQRDQGCIPCHQTLDGDNAVCRGFYDQHRTAPLQIAERLGYVEFVPVQPKSTMAKKQTKKSAPKRAVRPKPRSEAEELKLLRDVAAEAKEFYENFAEYINADDYDLPDSSSLREALINAGMPPDEPQEDAEDDEHDND